MSSLNVKYDLQLNYNYEDFASAAMGEIGSWRLMRWNVFSSYLDTLIALNISENKLKKHFMHILGFWNKNSCLKTTPPLIFIEIRFSRNNQCSSFKV